LALKSFETAPGAIDPVGFFDPMTWCFPLDPML